MQQKYKVREIKYLKPNELQRFFNQAKKSKRDYALFLTIYRYGLRASEATLLMLDDVDFENDKINIKRVKNGISMERMLFSDVKRALKAYLKIRLPKGETFFVGRKGPLTPNRINGLFKIKKIAPEMSVKVYLNHLSAFVIQRGVIASFLATSQAFRIFVYIFEKDGTGSSILP